MSEESEGQGRNHVAVGASQQASLLGEEGQVGRGDTLCSIQKSQKATKNGHGQVTVHFPSSPL